MREEWRRLVVKVYFLLESFMETKLEIAKWVFFPSLCLIFILIIINVVYYSHKKAKGFIVEQISSNIIIKRNIVYVTLESISRFFYFTSFSIFIAYAKSMNSALLLLLFIFITSFIIAIFYFINEKSYRLYINKNEKIISIKEKQFLLSQSSLVIKKMKFNTSITLDPYALYITKSNNRKYKLYGYTSLEEITEIKKLIEV